MSLDPILWAMKDAPVADVEEWAILSIMAESADEDGCNAFQSTGTIAKRARLSEKTVQRRLDDMAARRIIAPGDQQYVKLLRIPADRRPVNYDLMIPYAWWGNVGRVNEWRAGEGRPPLTASDRPPLGLPPAKKRRADLGVTRGKRSTVDDDSASTSRPSGDGGTTSHPVDDDPEGTSSPGRGDCESPREGTSSHPTHPCTNPENPPRTTGALASLDAPVQPALSLVVDQPLVGQVVTEPTAEDLKRQHAAAARELVTQWINHWKTQGGVIKPSQTFNALVKSYVQPAYEVGYTEDQIKRALVRCGEVWPPDRKFREALLWAAGGTAPTPPSPASQRKRDAEDLLRRQYEEAVAEEQRRAAGGEQ